MPFLRIRHSAIGSLPLFIVRIFAASCPSLFGARPLLSLNAIVGFGPKSVPASCEPLFSQTLCQRIHAIVILRPFPASCPSLLSAKSFAVVECHYSASNTFLPVSDHCWASDRGFFFSFSLQPIVQLLTPCRQLSVIVQRHILCCR